MMNINMKYTHRQMEIKSTLDQHSPPRSPYYEVSIIIIIILGRLFR